MEGALLATLGGKKNSVTSPFLYSMDGNSLLGLTSSVLIIPKMKDPNPNPPITIPETRPF